MSNNKAVQPKHGGDKGKETFSAKPGFRPGNGISRKKRENLTSPKPSPEHISAFQNMLFAFRKSFSLKDLKTRPTGFEPVTLGSEDRVMYWFQKRN